MVKNTSIRIILALNFGAFFEQLKKKTIPMKKFWLLSLFITLTGMEVQAQQIEKNPGDFTVIKAFDRINVNLIPADQPKVVLSGSRASEVQVINQNGELRLRMPLRKLLSGESIDAVVYYQKLTGIEASEGSIITAPNLIEAVKMNLSAKEGAQITAEFKVSRLDINQSSGAQITVKGDAEIMEAVLRAGSELDAQHLKTKQTTVSLNAGGDARVYATDLVNAKVRAGGTIYVHGKPRELDQKVVLGGNVIQVNRE